MGSRAVCRSKGGQVSLAGPRGPESGTYGCSMSFDADLGRRGRPTRCRTCRTEDPRAPHLAALSGLLTAGIISHDELTAISARIYR